MKTIRIDNIECRKYSNSLSKENNNLYEIVKWGDLKFQSCHTVALLKMTRDDVNLESVGCRILSLKPDEFQTFMEVYKMADIKLRQKLQLQSIMDDDEKDGLYF
jgi:hypothetical protein